MKQIKSKLPPKISLAVSLVGLFGHALVNLIGWFDCLFDNSNRYLRFRKRFKSKQSDFCNGVYQYFSGRGNCCIIKWAFCQTYQRYQE